MLGHVAQSLENVLGVVEPAKGLTLEDTHDKEAQALAVVRWIVHVPIPDEEDAGAVTENVPVCIGAGQKVLLALGGLVENCFSLVWSEWKILCCKDPPAPPGAFSQPAEQKNMRLLC